MDIQFTKLQGNGNDFILIDEREGEVIPDEMKGKFALLYCDRRFGVGADGVIYLQKSESADIRMRLFQPDESEAEMCGNGIRCLAKYAFDNEYVKEKCTVETPAGRIGVQMWYSEEGEFWARVQLNRPAFQRPEIPATGEGEYREEINNLTVHAVNTGVPHAVVFVDEIGAVDIGAVAPPIRNHPTFPRGANVNFVERGEGDTLRLRTFERGVEAETTSCGTGAAAAAAIAHRLGLVGDTVPVETTGGPLVIRIGDTLELEGPAYTVYSGFIPC
ncbi:MAG: diaminopimelate epimerase [Methanomicrobiales archaeon]|nr:diaminopimelate epimerase [Methanomicrobiales archaeon]MDI6876883.1 diaminopimelate epimerase [Methanomicrobiales archaeon]